MWDKFGIGIVVLLPILSVSFGFVVHTKNGDVFGLEATTRDGKNYNRWVGIPYAKPPIDELRFQPPVPVESWEGVLDARRHGSVCAQIDIILDTFRGSEDCLFLNVHVPKVKLEGEKRFPVLFAIHGDLFASGEGNSFSPDYLLDEDIILVTANTRVGILGYLNTGDEEVRGNMGLKDIRMALKWTYENIEFFGGDPQKITVQGINSGGFIAHLMFMVNSTRDYVHKAISNSGTALAPWAIQRNPSALARNYAETLNCPIENTKDMVECLQRIDVRTLLDTSVGTSPLYLAPNWSLDLLFLPTIETVLTDDTFLSDEPIDLLQSGDFKPVPWMVSSTSREALALMSVPLNSRSFRMYLADKNNWEQLAQNLLMVSPEMAKRSPEIASFYLGSEGADTEVDPHSFEVFINVTDLVSDRLFYMGHQDAVQYHAEQTPNVYSIWYNKTNTHVSTFDIVKGVTSNNFRTYQIARELARLAANRVLGNPKINYGVCHSDDYMMLTPFVGWAKLVWKDSPDYEFSKEYVKLIVDFILSDSDQSDLMFQGQPVGKFNLNDPFSYFVVNDKPHSGISEVPFKNRYLFWKQLMG